MVAAATLLSGCSFTSDPMPQDYDGPIATIADSGVQKSRSEVDFFFVKQVDGNDVSNSVDSTAQANEGMGFSQRPVFTEHRVPAEATTFTIVGRTHYGAPILALANTVYEVSGKVRFTPVPNRVYQVTGTLGKDYSAVWVEDEYTGQIVSKKIEIHGSAALGFFSK